MKDYLESDEFLRKLAGLQVLAKKILRIESTSERADAAGSAAAEFATHRSYSAGDDTRYLDWNVYARLDELFDVARDVLADVRQLLQVATFPDELPQGLAEGLDRACRAVVGSDAERVGALDPKQIGDPIERARDVDVLHGDLGA